MKLFMSPASPFVRKILVTIQETGQQDAVELVQITTTPMATDEALAAANPLGKIPALVRDDGPTLYDSRVISRFLDARSGGKLYPENRLWDVLTLEATGDAIMDAAVSMTYELRFREHPSEAWRDAQWAKIDRALSVVNTRWMSHLHGPLDAAQISVACGLGYLDFRLGDRDWRTGRDALAAWFEAFGARPAMASTVPSDPK